MLVNIDEIKEPGLDRRWDVSREALDAMVAGDRAGWRAHGGVQVDAHLEKVERRILLRATARADLEADCRRCLLPVAAVVPVEFELTLVPAEGARAEGGQRGDHPHQPVAGSFDAYEAQEEVFRGKVIDLDPILREQLLLALPGAPVCGEGCKGLCSVCGGNLNEWECGCVRTVPDPRWAGLSKVKL